MEKEKEKYCIHVTNIGYLIHMKEAYHDSAVVKIKKFMKHKIKQNSSTAKRHERVSYHNKINNKFYGILKVRASLCMQI